MEGETGKAFRVAIRFCDVVCCERVVQVSELGTVAISFFFAFMSGMASKPRTDLILALN